jgi:Integron-associated effector binding protein
VTVHGPIGENDTVMDTWRLWFTENMGDRVVEKAYPSLHAVYYNYQYPHDPEKNQYDMIIGYMTKDGATQTDPTITTVKIPAQDYRYTTLNDISPESIQRSWTQINTTPASELARSYEYDLDMYNEAHTEMTIAVSVKE